ncbi:hypothetical protein 1 [Kummerowia striata microvirus]|nr:hypothetical protein 1 [Kummerowia striata microvirus]
MGVAAKIGKSLREFRRPKQMELEDYLAKTRAKGLNDEGELIPDPVPVAPPIGYKRQPTMVEIIRNMVQSEKLAEEARAAGMETFEESEDFDVGDENAEELRSGFENDFDPPIAEIAAAVDEAKKPVDKVPEKPEPKPADPAEVTP